MAYPKGSLDTGVRRDVCAYSGTFESIYHGGHAFSIISECCNIINVVQFHRGDAEMNVRVVIFVRYFPGNDRAG